MNKTWIGITLGAFISIGAIAAEKGGPCASQKAALLAKKEACHALPKEQRAACKEERKQLKAALESCKAEAKAKKASESSQSKQ